MMGMKLNNFAINRFFCRGSGIYDLTSKVNRSETGVSGFIAKIKRVENTPVDSVFLKAGKPSAFTNLSENIKQNGNDFSVGNVKSHKHFRGVRCWLSGVKTAKHTVKIDEHTVSNRVGGIIDKLTEKNNNVALLNFKKSAHSVIIMHHGNDVFSMYSVYRNNKEERCIKKDRGGIANHIYSEMMRWHDMLQDESIVYLHDLNLENIDRHINSFGNHKFNLLSHNCSRFVAKALLAGFNNDNNIKFAHDRKWQMPANTLELAKEIALESARSKYKEANYMDNDG